MSTVIVEGFLFKSDETPDEGAKVIITPERQATNDSDNSTILIKKQEPKADGAGKWTAILTLSADIGGVKYDFVFPNEDGTGKRKRRTVAGSGTVPFKDLLP